MNQNPIELTEISMHKMLRDLHYGTPQMLYNKTPVTMERIEVPFDVAMNIINGFHRMPMNKGFYCFHIDHAKIEYAFVAMYDNRGYIYSIIQ